MSTNLTELIQGDLIFEMPAVVQNLVTGSTTHHARSVCLRGLPVAGGSEEPLVRASERVNWRAMVAATNALQEAEAKKQLQAADEAKADAARAADKQQAAAAAEKGVGAAKEALEEAKSSGNDWIDPRLQNKNVL